MNIVLGVTFAVLTSIFYAISAVPRKFSKSSPLTYVLFDCLGFFIMSILFFSIIKLLGNTENLLDPKLWGGGALCALTLVFGSLFLWKAIDQIGLSKSTQWKNLQGPLGSLLIFFIFGEALQVNIWFLLASIIAILISAILFSIKDSTEKKFNLKGVLYAVFAALFFGGTALMQKYLSVEGFIYSQQVSFSFFALLFSMIFVLIKEKNLSCLKDTFKKDNLMGLLTGTIYFFGSLFVALSYMYISGAVAFTIVQLNAFWAILIGIIFFKEIDFKKHWKRIILGFLFVALGIALLSFS